MILRSILVLIVLICDVQGMKKPKPTPRPGKCPKITVITSGCVFCKFDTDCNAPERCCGGCCNANLLDIPCLDKNGQKVGECVFPNYCTGPNMEISTIFQCPQPWRKRGCKCCVPKKEPPATTRRPEKPGKCPNVPRVCFPAECQNDYDCKGTKKCCNRCCVERIECSDPKQGIYGYCEHPDRCFRPYHKYYDIGCPKRIGEPKCVCCALPPPPKTTTTKRPPKPGKCPYDGRQCHPPQCRTDYDCKGTEKCCRGCCRKRIECEDPKRHLYGYCTHPKECSSPYQIYHNIFCPPSDPRCVCCARRIPPLKTTTTKKPSNECRIYWDQKVYVGLCLPKKRCRKIFEYSFKCKGNHGCTGKKICCFRSHEKPPKDHCKKG